MAEELSLLPGDLTARMDRLDATYDSASDRPGQIAKSKLFDLAQPLARDAAGVGRIVARIEAGLSESDIQPLAEGLRDALAQWRSE